MADEREFPQELVQRGLRKELMPQHVAFVMDGNRRWAEAQGLTTAEGHEAGGRALEKILELSAAWGHPRHHGVRLLARELQAPRGKQQATRSLTPMMILACSG